MRRLWLLGFITAAAACAAGPDPCSGARDLRLMNGKIVTMEKRSTIASEVTIQNGAITAVGPARRALNPCTKTINLRGRTAIPGLIDNHNHIVLLGMRPGHDIRLETASSIADVQSMIRARVKTVPAGAWITALGDWNSK